MATMIQQGTAFGRAAAAVGGLILLMSVASCGTDEPADAVSTAPATAVATAGTGSAAATTIVPASSPPEQAPAVNYTVVAGDTLYGIARQHCSTVDAVIAVNGWADGANHAIYPADTVRVPATECQVSSTTGSAATTTTIDQAGHVGEPGDYEWTLWGDPADSGAIYASAECTELRAAGNNLTSETDSIVEDPAPGQRFLAAVAAMPDKPSSAVQAAIDQTVELYTSYAPIWIEARRDADDGLGLADNPTWRAAIDAFNAAESQRSMMWGYVTDQCPAIGISED